MLEINYLHMNRQWKLEIFYTRIDRENLLPAHCSLHRKSRLSSAFCTRFDVALAEHRVCNVSVFKAHSNQLEVKSTSVILVYDDSS